MNYRLPFTLLFGTTLASGCLANTKPLLDLSEMPFSSTDRAEVVQQDAEKTQFAFHLPEHRTNWNTSRWSWAPFPETMDLSAYQGLEVTVSTEEPRDNVGVYLALREDDGTWYYHPWAGHLVGKKNTYTISFEDFHVTEWASPPEGEHFDDNNHFDLDRIDALAIGVINPMGIGTVQFAVHEINLVAAEETASEAIKVEVPGTFFAKNHTEAIPAGLFGSFNLRSGSTEKYRLAQDRRIHHTGLDGGPAFGDEVTHMMINAIGDRVRPSPRLTHSDWEERSRALGKRYGEAGLESEFTVYAEYWNEAYLNWANRNRAGFVNRFFDESRAEEGGPVHIKHDGEKAPHLRWTRDFDAPPWQWTSERDWRRGKDERGRQHSPVHAPPYRGMDGVYGGSWTPHLHPPEDVEDGETYEANGRTLTAFTPWHIYDETQFTYWSGKGMLKFYNEPMLAFGEALKETDPDAVFMVGWGFRASEDHWAAWDMVYRPTIDAAIHIADGWVDHDYGGDPRRLAANYETVTHYTMTEHDKWLYGFNTETAMGSDPQAYPDADVVAGGTLADVAKRTWTSRKVMHALRFVPDKARSFSHFGHGGGWFSDSGEGVALMVMRNLRGRMLTVENDDFNLYVVASIDGTDPQNPRPGDMPDRQELVVAVLNDHRETREIDLKIQAPEGTRFTELILREPAIVDGDQVMREENLPFSEDDHASIRLQRELPARHLVTFTLPLEGEITDKTVTVRDQQYFGGNILQRAGYEEPASFAITIPAEELANGEKATLRFVAEHLQGDQGRVLVNGHAYNLPSAIGPENSPFIRELTIDAAHLQEENELRFEVTEDRFASYLVCSASLYLRLNE
ncbi:MAG: hypothetical protein LAT58_13150 [Opitutales bacterium]|nr:hypothetical protein [Opitutales bacterium]